MNRRAQSAVEFVGLIAFMFIVFFGFFLLLQGQIIDATERKDAELLSSLNSIIVSQVELAASIQPDFKRVFHLPVLPQEYNVQLIDERDIVISLEDGTQHVNFLPRTVKGDVFSPGTNQTIFRYDGVYTRPDGVRQYDVKLEGIFLNVPAEKCVEHDMNGSCSSIPARQRSLCSSVLGVC